MAGEWIKIRTDLLDDPSVFLLSEILGLDCPTVVGHLVMFWSWMDRHTSDGKGIKLTENVIDKKIGVDGFANALREVDWLCGENMALELPLYERHNGNSAKARALESEAKRLRRDINKNPEKAPEKSVGQVSDKTPSESPTREEKRREEKNTDIKDLTANRGDVEKTEKSDSELSIEKPKPCLLTKKKRKLTGKRLAAFELFWEAFDYKKGKADAADAWLDLELDQNLFDLIIRSALNCAKSRSQEITRGKTPIYPQGWLTGRRWEDQDYVAPSEVSGFVDLQPAIQRLTDRSWADNA